MEHRTCATPGPKGTDSVLRNQRRGKGKKGGRERGREKRGGREDRRKEGGGGREKEERML